MVSSLEEEYYFSYSRPLCDNLQEAIEIAKIEFNEHPSPYVVRVYDYKTRECVFSLEK